MYLNILLVFVFAFCLGFLVQNGLWTNALILINTITAALLAVNFWEPLADFLEKQLPSYTYLWDFVALWAAFALSMLVLRVITDMLSRVKVRFRGPVNQAGGIFFACWTAWVMVCFTTMTLHTAPLARSFLDKSFAPTPDTRMFFGLAPDRRWLGFVQKESIGAFRRAGSTADPDAHKFDPTGDFIYKYAERRAKYENEMDLSVAGGRK